MTLRLARAFLPAVLLASTGAAVIYAVSTLGLPWELYPGEAQNAFFSDRFASTGELYFDWGDDELVFPIYGPIYYAVVAPVSWVAGSEIWGARLVSLIACSCIAVCCWATARQLGTDRLEALIGSVAWISLPAGAVVLFNARPDAVGLAFMAGAVLLATRWEESRKGNQIAWVALLLSLMVMTRQNFAPIAVALILWVGLRDRGAAVRLTGFLVATGLAVIVLFELISGGAFLASTRDFNAIGYSLASLRAAVDLVTLPLLNPIFAGAAVGAFVLLRAWRRAPAVVWAWLGAGIVAFSAVRIGSSDNYFLPLAVLSSIVFAVSLKHLRDGGGVSVAIAATAAVALVLLPGAAKDLRTLSADVQHLSDLDDASSAAEVAIESAGGTMFGDRTDLAEATGNAPGLDAFNHTLLADVGVWDPAVLAGRISAAEFEVIQTSFDANEVVGWAPDLISALRANYCETYAAEVEYPGYGVWLYEPCEQS